MLSLRKNPGGALLALSVVQTTALRLFLRVFTDTLWGDGLHSLSASCYRDVWDKSMGSLSATIGKQELWHNGKINLLHPYSPEGKAEKDSSVMKEVVWEVSVADI